MNERYIVSQESVQRFVCISATVLFAALIIIYTKNPVYHLFAIWMIVIIAILLCKIDFMHPYCWFSASYALYNTSYTMLYCTGAQTAAGYSYLNSLYTLLGLYVVLVIVGPETVSLEDYSVYRPDIKVKSTEKWFYALSMIIIVFSFILKAEGYSGKTAMKQSNDIFYRLGVHFVRWMMVFMLITLFYYAFENRRKIFSTLFVGGIPAVLFSLCTGERDVLFRYAVIIVIALFAIGIIKRRHIVILIPFGIVVMIASVYLKYTFLTGNVNTRYFSNKSLLELFLSTDFLMAGRNFQWLIHYDWTKGYFGLSLLFSELFDGIIPFVDWTSVTSWFQSSVYPAGYKNVAFTLLGTGYVMDGALGIIIIFAIVGLLLRWLYRKSNKNIYTMVIYIYSITVFISAFRSTLNNLLMQLIKGALVAYLLHKYICQRVVLMNGED